MYDPSGAVTGLAATFVFAVAFLPGLALLLVAKRSRWRPWPTALSILLLLVPLAAFVALSWSPDPRPTLQSLALPILFVLGFLPGFLLVLRRWLPPAWALGPKTCVLYLLPYVVLALVRDYLGAILAVSLLMLFWPRDRWRLLSRLVVVLVLIAPIAWPVSILLRTQNALAEACAHDVGSEIGSRPSGQDTVALDIREGGCGPRCQSLLLARRVAAVETGSPGALMRYTLVDVQGSANGGQATAADGRACAQTLASPEGERCLLAEPIDGYTARYLVRTPAWTTDDNLVQRARAEVIDQRSGDVVAWTVSVHASGNDDAMHDAWMLEPLMTLQSKCDPNGMRQQDFLDAWFADEG